MSHRKGMKKYNSLESEKISTESLTKVSEYETIRVKFYKHNDLCNS